MRNLGHDQRLKSMWSRPRSSPSLSSTQNAYMIMQQDCGSSNKTFPCGQNLPVPLTADLAARRSISDSSLQRGCPSTYNHKNTAFMLISRSGGSTVKQIITTITQIKGVNLPVFCLACIFCKQSVYHTFGVKINSNMMTTKD